MKSDDVRARRAVPGRKRRSIRLKGYDYSRIGAYFVTICTQNRECLFGDVADGEMRLNALGKIVWEEWFRTAEIRPYVRLNEYEFVVMPNHAHGIVWVVGDGAMRAATVGATGRSPLPDGMQHPRGPKSRSLGAIIAGFKSAATKRINQLRQTPGAPLWQRNYYEHIIRNDQQRPGIEPDSGIHRQQPLAMGIGPEKSKCGGAGCYALTKG